MAEDERVEVILLFLETIRNPRLFAQAAREAARRGKRVIALKVGASEGERALVQAHTGSLAGEDELYEAYFKALGVVRVRDLEEMLETAALFCANPALPSCANVAVVTLSGGEAALLSDIGHELGLDFARLGAETVAKLRPAFPDYATLGNPVDAWGLGFDRQRFQLIVDTLLADPSLGTVTFSVNAASRRGEDVPYARAIAEACVAVRTDKHIVFVNNSVGNGVDAAVRKLLAPAGIAYLSGMRAGLAAVRNMAWLTRAATRSAWHPPRRPRRRGPLTSRNASRCDGRRRADGKGRSGGRSRRRRARCRSNGVSRGVERRRRSPGAEERPRVGASRPRRCACSGNGIRRAQRHACPQHPGRCAGSVVVQKMVREGSSSSRAYATTRSSAAS